MSFSPASSFEPATVTVAGTVAVSNFPASQAVTGPLTAAQLIAAEPLSVTGPLTDAQLAARLPLSVSGTVSVGNTPHVVVDSGSISVGNFPADQVVHFSTVPHVIVDSGAVTVSGTATVSGTVAVTQGTSPWVMDGSGVVQPVSGPLTDTQLRASAVKVDGSAVTQPISADSLPLPDGAADNDTLSEIAITAIIEREKLILH